jgi:hypothetical protein
VTNTKENSAPEIKPPSKLFAMKNEFMGNGFWSTEEEINNALDAFANEDIHSLAEGMYELMFKFEQTIETERIKEIDPNFPRSHVHEYYGTSDQIWEQMLDLIRVMILKVEQGEIK